MRYIIVGITLSLCLILQGCDWIDDLRAAREAAGEVAALKGEVSALKENTKTMQERIDVLLAENAKQEEQHKRLFSLIIEQSIDLDSRLPKSVSLTPTNEGYGLIFVGGGFLSVSCDDISPYGNGTKLTITVVNFMSVQATNINIEMDVFSKKLYDEKGELRKNFESLIPKITRDIDKIPSGTGKKIEMRIPDIKPDELQKLLFRATNKGVSYRDDSRVSR